MYADLHVHTTASDGTATPEQIVQEAKKIGLAAVGITDHDNIDAILPARRASRQCGVEVVPGVEFSTEWQHQEIHILGYYLKFEEAWFQERLRLLQADRIQRAKNIVKKLDRLGFPIGYDRVRTLAGSGAVGRPHIAQALMEKGYAISITDAFTRFIGRDAPAYVPRRRVAPEEAVSLILKAGGVPVMAHVGVPPADALIEKLVAQGLKGLEVYYPDHDQTVIAHYLQIAKRYCLLATGGSDFHGFNRERAPLGACRVDYRIVQALKKISANQEPLGRRRPE